MFNNKKLFVVVLGIHLIFTIIVGVVFIYLNAEAIRNEATTNTNIFVYINIVLSLLLFPMKAVVGEWLLSVDIKWLFFPAILINSFIWAMTFDFISSKLKNKNNK